MKKFAIQIQKELPDRGEGSTLPRTHPSYQRVVGFTLKPWYAILAFVLLVSCSDDDQTLQEPWEHELDQLRTVVAPYQDIENALQDGYDNEFTGYRTQMGYHYLKASLLDNTFELEQPEVVLYAPDAEGNLQFVAVEYAVPIENMDDPPPAPGGFTGEGDVWEINTEFKVWTLHVWVGLENSHGIFAAHNPSLP